MAAPGQSGRSRFTIIILVLLSVTLITLDMQDFGPLGNGQAAARDVLSPATDTGGTIFSPITNAWRSLTEFDDLEAENEALRDELGQIRGDAIAGQAARETLDQLLGELDIDILAGVDTTVARVADPSGNFDDFTIDLDKGRRDGIRDGMPVVTSAGLVGRIVAAERDRSQVELITETGFGLGVRVIGPGDIALARGVARGQDLEVNEGVDESSVIAEGMLVVTSGIEGSPFPADIPVGVVTSVEIDEAELQQQLHIRPVAELDRLSFVTVILWTVNGVEDLDGDEDAG